MNASAQPRGTFYRRVGNLQSVLFQPVFSSYCLLCGEMGPSRFPVCTDCQSTFRVLGPHCCATCGRPFADQSVTSHSDSFECECRGQKLYFDRAFSTFSYYEGKMRDAILRFKYRRRFRVGEVLGELWSERIGERLKRLAEIDSSCAPDMIIPVPLHSSRLREREFNQSAILAKAVGKALDLRVVYSALERVRATQYQTGLSPRQRGLNVKGAFEVTRPGPVAGASILLVDDVFTTGSTVNECSKVLMKAKASSVVVGTLARAAHTQTGVPLCAENVPMAEV